MDSRANFTERKHDENRTDVLQSLHRKSVLPGLMRCRDFASKNAFCVCLRVLVFLFLLVLHCLATTYAISKANTNCNLPRYHILSPLTHVPLKICRHRHWLCTAHAKGTIKAYIAHHLNLILFTFALHRV
jgi:hypothetical protein